MISIDIGSKKVCVIEGSYHSGHVNVTGWGEIIYDNDLIADGVITDQATLSFLISEIIKRNNFKSKNTVVTINNSDVIVRELVIPLMKQKEMQTLVENEMKRIIGSDGKYIIDYITGEKAEDKMIKVTAYALESEKVDSYHKLVKNLKLSAAAMDIHSNSLSKLLNNTTLNNFPHSGENIVIADIGYSHISFHGFTNGIKMFDRTELSPLPDFLREAASITRSEINNELINGLDFSMENLYQNSILADTCRYFISRLSDEIQRYIQYMIINSPLKVVSKVYLIGGIVHMNGLSIMLANSLSIPVETLNQVGRLTVPNNCAVHKIANAAGALIRL